jgi:hypothetical protein
MLKTMKTMWMMVIALLVTMTAMVRRLMVWTRMRYSRRHLEWFELERPEEQRPVKRRQLNSGAPAGKAKQRGPTVSQMTTEVQLLTRTNLVFGVWSKYRPIKTSRTTCRKRQVCTGYSNIEQLFITSCLICTTIHTHPPSEEREQGSSGGSDTS